MFRLSKPPVCCDACSSVNIRWITEENSSRKWPMIWKCLDCNASVGCVEGTQYPLGYMANVEVRQLRLQLHSLTNPLWQTGPFVRNEVYAIIAKELDLNIEFAHIAQLNVRQLKYLIAFFESNSPDLIRNKRKRKQKEYVRRRRNANRIAGYKRERSNRY